MNRERLKETIRKAEGFAAKAYFDVSQYSGGYGSKLPKDWDVDTPITKSMAEAWLDRDLDIAVKAVNAIFRPPPDTNDIRIESLVEMAYNVGQSRLSLFKKMIAAVNAGDWAKAAIEATDSKWYRQVGTRSMRIVHQIESGDAAI